LVEQVALSMDGWEAEGRHSAPRKEIPLLKIGEAIGWGLLAVSQRLGKLLERQELEDERQELLRERT